MKFLNLALFLAIFSFSYSQDPTDKPEPAGEEQAQSSGEEINGDAANGYDLFQQSCIACHKIDGDMVGPALRDVVARVKEEGGVGRQWLHDWIKDNNALRASGDKYANEVFERYNKIPMLTFPNLSDQDIDDILAYTSDPEGGEQAFNDAKQKKAEESAAAAPPADSGSSTTGIVIFAYVVLALLLLFTLFRLSALKRLLSGKTDVTAEDKPGFSLAQFIHKYNKAFNVLLAALSLLALYGLWIFMFGIGVDKGYQPDQPIYFSHQVHAGVQGIDCQYCHSSAKYGKVSGIPSPNTCMNCHKMIKEYKGDYYEEELVKSGRFASGDDVKNFYTGEIQKMYAAIGWDPDQAEYTGEQKPIEWVRIHNMPDFVYFSHEQHVVAGENAILKAIKNKTIPNSKELNLPEDSQVCFACHGDVSKMDEVKMANDFTMGWCVECHRTTEVDMTNEYNSQYYADLHEKLKKEYGDHTKITVDAIGGLECAKCHY